MALINSEISFFDGSRTLSLNYYSLFLFKSIIFDWCFKRERLWFECERLAGWPAVLAGFMHERLTAQSAVDPTASNFQLLRFPFLIKLKWIKKKKTLFYYFSLKEKKKVH